MRITYQDLGCDAIFEGWAAICDIIRLLLGLPELHPNSWQIAYNWQLQALSSDHQPTFIYNQNS